MSRIRGRRGWIKIFYLIEIRDVGVYTYVNIYEDVEGEFFFGFVWDVGKGV